jgi:GT2 family glycosyltransferase
MQHEANSILAQTSIVIALKDDYRVFDCIASVDEDVEIVLALNGTPPELRAKLVEHFRRPVIAEIPEAGNLGAAYNAGIEATAKRYILLMDSDCRFAPKAIRAMAERVARYPVVKGQVVYGTARGIVSKLISRIREFDEGDYLSALSPPLIYDRAIAARIGGYHFDSLIHWCEDREFDFRLQMANVPVCYEPDGVIFHDAQVGAQDLRSYWRYGIGEGIAQELGIFTTSSLPVLWRTLSDSKILIDCAREKGLLAALYYFVTLCAFHAGTAWHLLTDPYQVRPRYPKWAARVRLLRSIPQHCTALTDEQKQALRERHARAGCVIQPSSDFEHLLSELQTPQNAGSARTTAAS